MTIPGRLSVGPDGKVTGPIAIKYNDPWPCVNGSYGSGKMQGLVEHTMVGDLPGTIMVFNDPSYQASAHFGVAQDGSVHQFGPIGKGWIAWHAVAANQAWYGCEFADHGNPDNPLTLEQITAGAQILEVLSRFAGFPLQVTDSVDGRGLGTHSMGGAAFGGHTCPDVPPRHVRSAQRQAIVDLAKQIRAVGQRLPTGRHQADGKESLADLGVRQGATPADLIFLTARIQVTPGPLQVAYVNVGDWHAAMPAGMVVWVP